MIFPDIKAELESLLGIKVYPLIGPQTEKEYCTIQLVSDPEIVVGTLRTSLVNARYQVSFISGTYARVKMMDTDVWKKWRLIQHGHIGTYPVQYVSRGGIRENFSADNGGVYQLIRDFILCYPGDAA